MNREGQTWCDPKGGVVFVVLKTHKPMPGRDYYVHEVLYLEHARLDKVVGTKVELEEARDLPFTKILTQVA